MEADYSKSFWNDNIYPVYKYDQLKTIISDSRWTVEKIPMFVDGVVVWTHFKVTLPKKGFTQPYNTDVDIQLKMLHGAAWLMMTFKGKHGGTVVEAGDIIIIPNGASYHLMNQSINEICVYTLDANTLLELEG